MRGRGCVSLEGRGRMQCEGGKREEWIEEFIVESLVRHEANTPLCCSG